jgi:acyl-CoA dehydrogenase
LQFHASAEQEQTDLAEARSWRAQVFDAGFGWLGGPVALGGAGRSPLLDEEYRRLELEFDIPSQNIFSSATSLVAPSILECGSDDLKCRYLPGMFRGDIVCCQLLSEPDFGSDLAGIATRAVRDGDEWVVNGQKVWNSYAHLSEAGQLLARTDPAAEKHRGLTMFLLDMATPGVIVKPLRQMTGEYHFNEVFLQDVRVPDRNRVGAPGEGWRAMQATLMSERHAVGTGATSPGADPVDRLIQLARVGGKEADPAIRQQLAQVVINSELLRFLNLRTASALRCGRPLGAEGSISKLLNARQATLIGDVAALLLGPAIAADNGQWGTFAWSRWVAGAPHRRIAGGTDEIQRNILGERMLGLPREPR